MNVHKWISLLLVFALIGCGGGGNAGTPGPQLDAVSVTPTSAYTGGTRTLSGTVVVGGMDASSLQITLANSNGTPIAQGSGTTFSGPGQGLLWFSTNMDTAALSAGTYRINVQATSSTGGVSNVVAQTFQLIANPWQGADPMPHTVSEFAVTSVGSKVYVLTGLSTVNGIGTATSEVQIYDTVSGQWSTGPQAPRVRAGATAAVVGSSIYLMGGYNAANPTGLAFVDVLDTQTGSWSTGPATPTARFYSCAATIGSSIYLVDGTQSITDSPSTSALESLDTTTGTWYSLASSGFAVSHPGCAVLGGLLYVNGGDASSAGFSELIASQWYNPILNIWSTTNYFSYNRTRHASVAIAGRVIIIGGRSDAGGIEAVTAVTEAYTPASNSWSIRAPMPFAAQDVGAVVINGIVYVFTPTSSYIYDALSDTL
ncbi:MAG: hypothetical protein KKH12_11875 [Gammaproteobacteria bacterium]|nr:hypothetical protein [Gammaproteobacteria bacterium]MBU1482353.1 hypothetical protein [Gammaproteobacteria bacterium]